MHYLRGLLEDLSRCAAEAGEVHAALCIGLDAVVNDSEENTHEVMQQHKTLLNKLVQETQARQAAEEALNAHLKGQGRSFGLCLCMCLCLCLCASMCRQSAI